jgi:hypothetical protein
LQWKCAQLYFVRRWNCEGIGAKYGLVHQRVRQILNTWTRRAIETGHIQFIPPLQDVAAAQPPRIVAAVLPPSLPPFVDVNPALIPAIPARQWVGVNVAKEAATRV